MATMMGTVSEGIKETDLNYMKANNIFNTAVRNVLYFIFTSGCTKPHDMTVKEYLLRDRGLSNEKLKRYFLKGHIRKMENDPEGKTFDLSLLYVCIQKVCRNVADYEDDIWKTPSDTFENALYSLKQKRNMLVHDRVNLTSDELMSLVNDVNKNIETLIKKAKEKFKIPDADVDGLIKRTNENIFQILCSDIIPNQSCEETEHFRFNHETVMKTDGKTELQRRLRPVTYIDLFDVAFGIQEATKVPVDDVFTDLEIEEVQKLTEISRKINFENLLEEVVQKNSVSPVIIVEGVAGSGKTTLVKKLISDWINRTEPAHILSHYDLLLYTDCRSTAINGFESLLQSLLPKTSLLMPIEDLIQTVLNLNTLVVIDGFDYTLHSSVSLLREIFHNHSTRNRMHVLITTRPEKINVLCRLLPANRDVYRTKINGIPVDRRVEFISKLGKAVERSAPKRKGGKRKEQKEQNVTGLITYFSTTPWLLYHFGLPTYLYLLTILFLKNRETFQYLRTPTSLYVAMMNVMRDKLVERLYSGNSLLNMTKDAITDLVNEFLDVVFLVSLIDLDHDTLSKKSLQLLTKTCFDLELPEEEILHAFLSVKRPMKDKGTSLMISFPHKGIQEFYAACAVLSYLNQGEKKKVIRKVIKDIRKTLQCHLIPAGISTDIIQSLESTMREKLNTNPTVEGILKDLHGNGSSLNLFLYQKVLIHLIGLLKMKSQLKETLVRELVSLLERTNLSDAEKWLDIITEAECDRHIVSEVGNIIPKDQICVRDGNLMAALLLLQENKDFENIELHIANDPHKLPELKKILDILANRETNLKLTFIHQWRYPELGSSDEFLESSSRNLSKHGRKLSHFTGSLKHLSSLGKRVVLLQLALGSRYARNQERNLDYMDNFVNVEVLGIHIVGGLPLACLPQLPKKLLPVDLWFSDTRDSNIEWTEKAIRRLLGTNMYRQLWSIRFPRSKFTVDGCLKLAKYLKSLVIGKSGVWVSSTNLSPKDLETLQKAYLLELNCKFCLSDEINIWTF